MQEYLPLMAKTELFEGIKEHEIQAVLGCTQAKLKRFGKKEMIFFEEDRVTSFGVLVSGAVMVFREDYEGRRAIVSELRAPALFAESIAFGDPPACVGGMIARGKDNAQADSPDWSGSGQRHCVSPVSVRAEEESEVLFIEAANLTKSCANACAFHARLIENLLRIISVKNLFLNQKLTIVSQKTTREKLLAYFSAQQRGHGRDAFELPFSREELADYLFVNRSAMSRELSALREEGILEIKGRRVKLNH